MNAESFTPERKRECIVALAHRDDLPADAKLLLLAIIATCGETNETAMTEEELAEVVMAIKEVVVQDALASLGAGDAGE